MDNLSETVHRSGDLSTGSGDKSHLLWISTAFSEAHKHIRRIYLWINLWIRGVKAVDNSVDRNVDKSGLWITRDLSTICPQETGGYPQFLPQALRTVLRIDRTDFRGYPHIHRPYYYY